jgi:signal transduction histidine kinase
LLVIVPGVLFGISAQRSSQASLEVLIGQRLSREAEHTARELRTTLRAERQTLVSFARQDVMREIRVSDIDKRVSAALQTLREGDEARLEYLVVDRTRRVLASSRPQSLGLFAPWLEAVERAFQGEVTTLGPVRRGGDARASFVIAAPIADPDSRGDSSTDPIGVLLGLYDWTRLTRVTSTVRADLAQQGIPTEVLVVRADGSVIGGTRSGGESEDVPTLGHRASSNATSGAPPYFVDEATASLVGHAPLGDEYPRWHVLIAEPLSAALAPARALTARLALVLTATLAIALVIATLAARRVVQPLSELTAAIRGLSRSGADGMQVPVRTEDEVGELATAFNDMSWELDRAQHDLAEAAKFAFVGELAGGIAHEVRTSLGVLRSSAQILARSVSDDGDQQASELASMIREEVDRLGGVVDDLLGLARPRALQLEPTGLCGPVFRAIDFAEPQATEAGIEIERIAHRSDPVVLCDSELIHQVVLNLVVNAIQALAAGGTGGKIEVAVIDESAGGPAIEVRDDGPGVPEALRERLFLPFVTGREKGIGLGLTFVKRVVYEHGGRTLLETGSTGTCFRIELPARGDSEVGT